MLKARKGEGSPLLRDVLTENTIGQYLKCKNTTMWFSQMLIQLLKLSAFEQIIPLQQKYQKKI